MATGSQSSTNALLELPPATGTGVGIVFGPLDLPWLLARTGDFVDALSRQDSKGLQTRDLQRL